MHLRAQVIIKGKQEEIWNKLVNFSEYPLWNRFIKKISGTLAVGNTLNVIIEPPGKKPMNFKPVVTVVEKNKEFRWVGKIFFEWVFRGEHYFCLETVPEGTRFTQGEKFSGLLAPLLLKFIRESTQNGFETMNSCLKDTVTKESKISTASTIPSGITQFICSDSTPNVTPLHSAEGVEIMSTDLPSSSSSSKQVESYRSDTLSGSVCPHASGLRQRF